MKGERFVDGLLVVTVVAIRVMGVSAVLLGFLAGADGFHHRALVVTSVAPVVADQASGHGFVVGTDGIARTCPDQKNVNAFVQGVWKNAPLSFNWVPGSAVIVSTPERGYTLACIKVE